MENKRKLAYWLWWFDISDVNDELDDKDTCLILHKDYPTPLNAIYNKDISEFTFYTADGIETVKISDNKVSHFSYILKTKEYLEIIQDMNKEEK